MIITLMARLLVGAVIPEQQKNKLKNQHGITIEKIDELLKLDPTPKGSWMPWIIKWDKSGELPPNTTPLIQKFERVKNSWKPDDPRRNFGKYTPEELTEMLSGGKDLTRQERRELPKSELKERLFETGLPGAKLIVNDGTWKVWRVTNQKYEMLLSCADMSNADEYCAWCTKHDDYAKSYLRNGPIWPIYKNGEPYAQAHIGGGDNPSEQSMAQVPIILLDRHDRKMALSHKLLELFEVLKPLPDYQLFEKYVWMTLSEIPDDPDLRSYVERYIEDNGDNRLRVLYLKEHWWPEALMSLLEDDYEYGLRDIMTNATPEVKKEIMESEFGPEMMLYVNEVNSAIFPLFAEQGAFERFFSIDYVGDKLNLGALDPKVVRRFINWTLNQDRLTLNKSVKNFNMDDALAQMYFAYWKKNMAADGKMFYGPVDEAIASVNPEYARLKEERQGQLIPLLNLPPKLEVGEEVKRGPSWTEGNADGGPGSIGVVTRANNDGMVQVDWSEGHAGWSAIYRPPTYCERVGEEPYLSVVPVNSDYLPTGDEPIALSYLLGIPEQKAKRAEQPQHLVLGDKVIRGPEWWDGSYDMDSTTHQPGAGEVVSIDGNRVKVHWSNNGLEWYQYIHPTRFDVVKRSTWTGEEEVTQLGPYSVGTPVVDPQLDRQGIVISKEEVASEYNPDGFNPGEFVVRWEDGSVQWYDTELSGEHGGSNFVYNQFKPLKVGDRVTPGPNWNRNGEHISGKVTDLDALHSLSVYVSWDDGEESWYKYAPNYINRDEDEKDCQIMPLIRTSEGEDDDGTVELVE